MDRKIIKIIVIVAIIALVAGIGGLVLYKVFQKKVVVGRIEFDHEYHMTEVHPNAFAGVSVDADSYFKINADQKVGTLHLVGLTGGDDIQFIVTNYQEGKHKTLIDIEYIYQNQLFHLQAESTANEIRFKTDQTYRVDVTKENPEDITTITYNSTILVFTKEVAA